MKLYLVEAVARPNALQKRNRELLEADHVRRLDKNLSEFQREVQHWPSKFTEVKVPERTIVVEQPALDF